MSCWNDPLTEGRCNVLCTRKRGAEGGQWFGREREAWKMRAKAIQRLMEALTSEQQALTLEQEANECANKALPGHGLKFLVVLGRRQSVGGRRKCWKRTGESWVSMASLSHLSVGRSCPAVECVLAGASCRLEKRGKPVLPPLPHKSKCRGVERAAGRASGAFETGRATLEDTRGRQEGKRDERHVAPKVNSLGCMLDSWLAQHWAKTGGNNALSRKREAFFRSSEN